MKFRPKIVRPAAKPAIKRKAAPAVVELHRQQAELSRANRALRAISSCNQALIHATTEQELLEEICRVIVAEGGFRLAWIGYVERDESKTVRPVASAGYEAGYLEKAGITWADEPHGRGPTGTAIRTGKTAVCRDMLCDPAFEPWRKDAIMRGYASSIVLPLQLEETVLGAVSIYAAEPDAFGEEEVTLLKELAADLVYGIKALRIREEHSRALEALRQNEERFRQIVEASPNGICTVNKQGVIMQVNSRLGRMFGYRADELLGRPVEMLMPGNVRQAHELHRRDFQAKPRIRRMGESPSYPARRKDATVFPVDISLHPIVMPEGPMTLAILTDISDRLRATEALRRSEQELKEAQRIAHVGSWRLDLATNEVVWTEELYRMLCLDPARPPPPFSEHQKLFTAESWQRLNTALARTRELGAPYELELEMTRADGRRGWMQARGEALRDATGTIVGLHGTAQDITGRKEAEEALQFRNVLLSTQQDVSIDGILVVDEHNRILSFNRRFVEMWRIPAELAANKADDPVLTFVAGLLADPAAFTRRVEYLSAHREETGRDELVLADGRIFDRYSAPMFGPEERYYGRVWYFRDITDRKKLESQYLQAQKMDAFGQLAGGVAHDFNNILAVMLMQLNLLQSKSDLGGAVMSGLAELERHAMRGAELTRQLLMFSRRQTPETRGIDLNMQLEEVSRMLRRLLGDDISFELKKADAPLWIEADVGMIEQVVMNLCINARDAMHNGGRLTIEARPEEHPATAAGRAGKFACLTVADTGCGMSEATKARIFEPFFTTKAVGKGTGLGLATVYGIVQQHRGWVEVDSAPDHGSTFRVYFPIRESPITTAAETALLETPGGHESILLVEDERDLCASMADCLRLAGYRVVEAANGIDALGKWEDGRREFDLLVTDYLMPEGLTGVQLATQLVRMKDSLKVIIMSGYIPGARDSVSPWPTEFTRLAKPFEIRNLLQTVRQSLDAR